MTEVEEPLMGNAEARSEIQSSDDNLLERNLREPSVFVWFLTLSACLSGLLFGYDTGVISAALVSVHSDLGHPLTTLDKSLITSATAFFALIVSPVSGMLADFLGRKSVVLLADMAFILGAGIQAVSSTVVGMIVGRSVIGLAVGAGSFVAPLYIAEVSPAPFRGRLVTMNVLFITLGQVVAYVVGWAFVQWGHEDTSWRWMVGFGALPAVLQCLIMLFMPETPRWLVTVKREDEARRVLSKAFGAGLEVQGMVEMTLDGIVTEAREEEAMIKRRRRINKSGKSEILYDTLETWSELFIINSQRRALAIACLLQGLQQLCGFNSLMYFSATIFTLLGFESPTLTSLAVALTNFFMTTIALILIDKVGRRKILLWSLPFMAFGLLLCAVGISFIKVPAASNNVRRYSPSFSREQDSLSQRTAPLVVLTSIMIYVAAYALGLGNVPWMQSELFPLSVRSLGSGLSTCTNWSANFVVGLTFLPLMELLTPSWTFVIYAGVCIVGWMMIWCIYPETKGLSLEETGALLATGWGVGASRDD